MVGETQTNPGTCLESPTSMSPRLDLTVAVPVHSVSYTRVSGFVPAISLR